MPIWETPEILSGTMPAAGTPNIPGSNIKPELGLCILHQGIVSTEWALRLLQMSRFLPPFIYFTNRNQPYDTGREQITRAALKNGVKWVFHLDTDVLLQLDAIQKMIEWSEKFNLPVLSGLYWAKKPMKMPCAWISVGYHEEEKKYDFAPVNVEPHLAKGTILPVDVTGTGALLINADIFKKLDESDPDKPYFQWGVGRRGLLQLSEDFYFCMRCKNELGIQVHLATAVKCDHIVTAIRRGTDGEYEMSMTV